MRISVVVPFRAVLRHRGLVGLSRTATPLAVAFALSYYTVVGIGVAFARLAPRAAHRLEL